MIRVENVLLIFINKNLSQRPSSAAQFVNFTDET